jgi:hypothetical protein
MLVDGGECEFRYVPLTAYHVVVGGFVDFAEVCSGLGKATVIVYLVYILQKASRW